MSVMLRLFASRDGSGVSEYPFCNKRISDGKAGQVWAGRAGVLVWEGRAGFMGKGNGDVRGARGSSKRG